MKRHQSQTASATAQRAASEGAAGRAAPADSPRLSAQGAQLAQLRASGEAHGATVQRMNEDRQTTGHSLGTSHSRNRGGKITSHRAGKAFTQDPAISAAKDRARQERIERTVANSIAKPKSRQKSGMEAAKQKPPKKQKQLRFR